MYCLVVNKLMDKLAESNRAIEAGKDKYQMVLSYLLPILLNVLMASALGHTFKMETPMIVFSIFYTVLRVRCGGNLLKLDIKGALIRWVMGMILIKAVYMFEGSVESVWMLVSFLAISVLSVVIMTKAEGKNGAGLVLIMGIGLLAAVLAVDSIIVTAAVVGVLMQSLSLLTVENIKCQVNRLEMV